MYQDYQIATQLPFCFLWFSPSSVFCEITTIWGIMPCLKTQINMLPFICFKIYLRFLFYYSMYFILIFEQLHLSESLKMMFHD